MAPVVRAERCSITVFTKGAGETPERTSGQIACALGYPNQRVHAVFPAATEPPRPAQQVALAGAVGGRSKSGIPESKIEWRQADRDA